MIYTVTMNPALDKTVICNDFGVGKVNREQQMVVDPGGKGINVSKALSTFKCKSIAVGIVGGGTGNTLKTMLEHQQIHYDFVNVFGETRVNTKIIDLDNNQTTELNEVGPIISGNDLNSLETKLKNYIKKGDYVVFGGSLPSGVEVTYYEKVVNMVHDLGAFAIIDTSKDALKHAIEGKPFLIKPNYHELLDFTNKDSLSEDEIVGVTKDLINQGIGHVVVSLGEKGAIYTDEEVVYRCHPLKVEAKNTVGAGDAFLAAMTYGLSKNLDKKEILKLAVATSASAVMTEGTKVMPLSWIEENKDKVKIEEF
jgi:1-phosphofructokinase